MCIRDSLHDMLLEQRGIGGSVPHVVPDILSLDALENHSPNMGTHGSCAWGDAATVIPWTLYLMYGDKALLEATFENMCGWVDYMIEQDKAGGDTRLWHTGFHLSLIHISRTT